MRKRPARTLLPGVAADSTTVSELDEDGNRVQRNLPLLDKSSESLRVCDSCFLAAKCPQYEPETSCAFELPVEARTTDQLARIQEVLIEIQVQRTLFARFSEEMEGGYPDPNVSAEMDRLQKMLKIKKEMDAEGFTLTVKAQARNAGQAGMFGRIFGERASEAARAIEPVRTEDAAEVLGIVDAEVIESGI